MLVIRNRALDFTVKFVKCMQTLYHIAKQFQKEISLRCRIILTFDHERARENARCFRMQGKHKVEQD